MAALPPVARTDGARATGSTGDTPAQDPPSAPPPGNWRKTRSMAGELMPGLPSRKTPTPKRKATSADPSTLRPVPSRVH
jgi:hypothetical protein